MTFFLKKNRSRVGFTLVELLVALMVTSTILAAVATLAFALSSASSSSADTRVKQAQVRFATLKISDLIKQCRLVCLSSERGVVLWRADDSADEKININELTYIDSGSSGDFIRLYECDSVANPVITLGEIDEIGSGWWDGYYDSDSYTELVADCNNAEFLTDSITATDANFVSLSFDLQQDSQTCHYQINGSLRGRAGHLLNAGSVVTDDD